MKCLHFRDSIYEYLEGSLAPGIRGRAEEHLAACDGCRRLLDHNKQAAQMLSKSFRSQTENLEFSDDFQRSIQGSLPNAFKPQRSNNFVAHWGRQLAWPVAIAFTILIIAVISRHPRTSKTGVAQLALEKWHDSSEPVTISLSFCVPKRTFHTEANVVNDSFNCNLCVVDNTLWLLRKNETKTLDSTSPRP